jgi:ectoine hydroxylase-related dioxygenase (phytanoyl-CoA dioxygenase family)
VENNKMKKFDLNHSLDQMKNFFLEEGYLYIKELFSPELIQSIRNEVLKELCLQGWAECIEGQYMAKAPAHRINSHEFYQCIEALMSKELIHSLSYAPQLNLMLSGLLGQSVFPHPRKMLRISYPYEMNPNDLTPAHQDVFYVRGEPDTFTVWIPLGQFDYTQGGLEVAPKTHLGGLYPTKGNDEGRFQCTAATGELDQLRWCHADFNWGDALIMHSLTLHRAIKNLGKGFRLSLDTRFSSAFGHINEEQLLPPYFPHIKGWDILCQNWENPNRFKPVETLQIDKADFPLQEVMQRSSMLDSYVKC